MGNEVLDFQNALIRISYGMDHMSVVKEWTVHVTTWGKYGAFEESAKQGK